MMKSLPQSLNLSPIELVWNELDRRVKSRFPSSVRQIWTLLQSEWKKLDENYFQKPITRMVKIFKGVMKNKENHFKEAKIV